MTEELPAEEQMATTGDDREYVFRPAPVTTLRLWGGVLVVALSPMAILLAISLVGALLHIVDWEAIAAGWPLYAIALIIGIPFSLYPYAIYKGLARYSVRVTSEGIVQKGTRTERLIRWDRIERVQILGVRDHSREIVPGEVRIWEHEDGDNFVSFDLSLLFQLDDEKRLSDLIRQHVSPSKTFELKEDRAILAGTITRLVLSEILCMAFLLIAAVLTWWIKDYYGDCGC